ncbi:zinc knuckle CX2CX4HX4C containing protein [Tanacetum coccineum]
MADNTKCTPKGIVENLLVKIDKFIFPIDFVILNMIEDFKMPIILGRHLLAMAHAKVDIFKKSISLKVGNEIVIFKMRHNFANTPVESVRTIRSKVCPKDGDLMNIDYDLFLYEIESCKFNHLLAIDPDIFTYDIDVQESYEEVHWCKAISQEKDNGYEYWASCDLYSDVCDGVDLPDNNEKHYWESKNDSEQLGIAWEELSFNDWECEDLEECGEDEANAIFKFVLDKLNNDWFKDNEAYKKRKSKLLGMTYRKPPSILIEKAEVTRYILGPVESYTKVGILGIDELPRTKDNLTTVRARLIEEMNEEGKA